MNHKNHSKEGNKLEQDIVCGMKVDPLECTDSLHNINYKEKNYYFCSPFCKAAFSEDPERYLTHNLKSEHDESEIDISED